MPYILRFKVLNGGECEDGGFNVVPYSHFALLVMGFKLTNKVKYTRG